MFHNILHSLTHTYTHTYIRYGMMNVLINSLEIVAADMARVLVYGNFCAAAAAVSARSFFLLSLHAIGNSS